jgi:hypothetical protein
VKRILIVNPRSDADFHRSAQEAASAASSAEDLEAALRRTYPNTVVRPRDLEGERWIVWYVYREGRWIPSLGGLEDQDE